MQAGQKSSDSVGGKLCRVVTIQNQLIVSPSDFWINVNFADANTLYRYYVHQ